MLFSFRNLWRRLLAAKTTTIINSDKNKSRKPRIQLQLEEMEPRLVPSTNIVNIPPNVSVADYRYDMTGVNTAESILTPANVNTNSFGKIWDNEAILGQVYAQPLYLPKLAVTVNGKTETQNTLLVAT